MGDSEAAEQRKDLANVQYKLGKYREAEQLYSEAIGKRHCLGSY